MEAARLRRDRMVFPPGFRDSGDILPRPSAVSRHAAAVADEPGWQDLRPPTKRFGRMGWPHFRKTLPVPADPPPIIVAPQINPESHNFKQGEPKKISN